MPRRRPVLAKISRPRLYSAVPRERLFLQLDEQLAHQLVWVAGPPGAGKTTLIASYLEARSLRVVWYNIDAGDADPAAWFYYLGLAAAERADEASNALPLLTAEALTDLRGFTRGYFRQFFACLPRPSVLVLDNLQDAAGAPLGALLLEACRELPDDFNIIAISRGEPPPALAELRSRGALAMLEWNDLRLTLEETRAISAAKSVADDGLVRALHERSDGWAAGLTLMLERLRRAGSGSTASSAGTPEAVFDYFAGLLFDQAPAAHRRILVGLSYLPRMTSSMAQEVSGAPEAGKLLDQLYRSHFFTHRREGTDPQYQFHTLFRSFLQARALEILGAEVLTETIRRCAQILEDTPEVEAAFGLYAQVGDWQAAARLVLRAATALMSTGRRQTLEQWIEALPASVREGDPWLAYWLGRAVGQMEPERGRLIVESAHTRFASVGNVMGRLQSASEIVRAIITSDAFGEGDLLPKWLGELANTIALRPRFPSTAAEAEIYIGLVNACWAVPWHPSLDQWAERLFELLSGPVDPGMRLAALKLFEFAYTRGDYAMAERIRRYVEPTLKNPRSNRLEVCWWHIYFGNYFFRLADDRQALEHMHEAVRVARDERLTEMVGVALLNQFCVQFRASDAATAEATWRDAERAGIPDVAFWAAAAAPLRAWLALSKGRLKEAAEHVRHGEEAAVRAGDSFWRMVFGLQNAEVMLEVGEVDSAETNLRRTREQIERASLFANMLAPLRLLEARLAQARGDQAGSLLTLAKALQLSRRQNGASWYRHHDLSMQKLFALALDHDLEVDYVFELIRRFRIAPPSLERERWAWSWKIRTLGRFEVFMDDRVLTFGRKTPKKVLALLKVLIALGPGAVREQQVLDALWPEDEGDAAHQSLHTALLRLRRLLGDHRTIRQQGGTLALERSRIWVDAWAFEEMLESLAQAGELESLRNALSTYLGAFLNGDIDEPWSVMPRERLRAKFVQGVVKLGQELELQRRYEDAIGWYLKGMDTDPIVEPFYQGLMRCYDRLDRRSEAVGVYRRLRQTLSASLGLKPSLTTERLYQSLRAG